MKTIPTIVNIRIYTAILTGILFLFPTFSFAAPNSDLSTRIALLQQQIIALQIQLNDMNVETPELCVLRITRDLKLYDEGQDVLELQKILNSDTSTQVAVSGVGSKGNETNYFGTLTHNAVIAFQEKFSKEVLLPVGLVHGSGYVGSRTRAKLQSVCTMNNSIMQKKSEVSDAYPVHTNITAAVFWIGEPVGGGSSEDNALSAWDDAWQSRYGGFDDPQNRKGYYPAGFTPKENPFYLDLPYNDFNNNGTRKANASQVIPWANEKAWGARESMMKNQWVKITHSNITCYGQIQDAGPYKYDDYAYVFGTQDPRPKSTIANNAGMDVSPALRDCLSFEGWNDVNNKVSWQFVRYSDVPTGPWSEIVTTSQINWPE